KQARLEHLLVNQYHAVTLRGRDDRNRHSIRWKRRPRLIFELGDVSAEILVDREILIRRHYEVATFDATVNSEALKAHECRAEMLYARVQHSYLRMRDRCEPDERAHFDVVRTDLMRDRGLAQRSIAVHGDRVGSDSVDAGAQRDQKVRKILHMRLAGGVPEDSRPFRRGGENQCVLRSGHARLIQKHIGTDEAI